MYTIKSNQLEATINPIGAELSGLRCRATGTEYIWQGDPAWWAGRAPVLFPILCSLKDGAYWHEGKRYEMPKHGFVRHTACKRGETQDKDGLAGEGAEDGVMFYYAANEETLAMYPFDFVLAVAFTIAGNQLRVKYSVSNDNPFPMYFSIGAHEAYRCPREPGETFEDYYLAFDVTADYVAERINADGLLHGKTETILQNDNILPLAHALFTEDALIFRNAPCQRVWLKSKKSPTVIEVDCGGAPHLAVWTKPGAPFICIEPWYGLPDETTHDGILANKAGIVTLPKAGHFSWTHTITIV